MAAPGYSSICSTFHTRGGSLLTYLSKIATMQSGRSLDWRTGF